jgi:hypothetical protein
MEAADTVTGVTTATGGTDIEAVGAVMAAGVATDTTGKVWAAAATGAVAEATDIRIEPYERCTCVRQVRDSLNQWLNRTHVAGTRQRPTKGTTAQLNDRLLRRSGMS